MATPGVTITANLQTVIDAAEADGSQLQITLCGFGAVIPSVAGTGMLADAGIPKVIAQIGSTPISLQLYNNAVINPAGTFYCFAVLDEQNNVIQANDYQFFEDGTFDLSDLAPILPGVPVLFNEAATRLSFTQYKLTKQPIGVMAGVFYNGTFQRPGIDYNMNGMVINLTFVTVPTDTVNAVYMALGGGGVPLKPGIVVDNLTITSNGQTSFTLSTAPIGNILLGLYYNAGFQGSTFYTVDATDLELTFSTYVGDNLYAVYIGS